MTFGKRNVNPCRRVVDMDSPGEWLTAINEWQRAQCIVNVKSHLTHDACVELLINTLTGNEMLTILENGPAWRDFGD